VANLYTHFKNKCDGDAMFFLKRHPSAMPVVQGINTYAFLPLSFINMVPLTSGRIVTSDFHIQVIKDEILI